MQLNKKLYDEIKSNVVGVGVPDDPKIIQKHTNNLKSNVPTSNIKFPTSNTAITLVALVITIIVLLILAGVTLSMVMGESGIFGKANSAKEQTQLKTAEDTIKLAVLDNRTLRETGDASALSNKNLKVSIAEKLRDLGYNVAEDNNIVTYYEDKTIKIEDYLGKEDNQGGITAQEIKDNPELYYGKEVDYTSANGQNDWKIFHSDGTNIYLITGNYVKVTKQDDERNIIIDTNKINPNTKMQIAKGGKEYRVNWSSSKLPSFNIDSTDILDNVFNIFKIKKEIYNINNYKENLNSKCVSSLLNTSNWEQYIDSSKGSGQYAIGGPTVELWMDSWNNRYKKTGIELYCNASNENGYFVGLDSEPTENSISFDNNEVKSDKLYFNALKKDGDDYLNFYWIASNSASSTSKIFRATHYSSISDAFIEGWGNITGGLRPIVCLQSNVTLKE